MPELPRGSVSPTIHPRADWGFPGWAKNATPYPEPDTSRTECYVHYEGGTPTRDTGAQAMRDIDAGHRANGWAGIGYNFVVMLDGTIWEGRGWGLVGAHCPLHNRSAWGVQVHIGGDQKPSPQALQSVDALYDEGSRRAGRLLAKRGHRDGYATECPGAALYAWVRAGMPVPPVVQPETGRIVDLAVQVSGSRIGVGVHERYNPPVRCAGDIELQILRGLAPAQSWQSVWRGPLTAGAVTVDMQTLVPHAGDWQVRAAYHPSQATWGAASIRVTVTTH